MNFKNNIKCFPDFKELFKTLFSIHESMQRNPRGANAYIFAKFYFGIKGGILLFYIVILNFRKIRNWFDFV
jgi:hypothetical protein